CARRPTTRHAVSSPRRSSRSRTSCAAAAVSCRRRSTTSSRGGRRRRRRRRCSGSRARSSARRRACAPTSTRSSRRRKPTSGAAIVDVGGESTRPGSDGVSLDEELRRVVPVLERLQGEVPTSIDTAKAEVARRALALGVELVNDVTALRGDPELAAVVADSGAYLCLMHMLGSPRTMQLDPQYDDVASEVAAFLEERLRFAVDAGIAEERI